MVARAHDAGVTEGVCILAMEEWDDIARAPRVAALWPSMRFSIGIHPHQAQDFPGPLDQTVARVRDAVQSLPTPCAVGEMGLDYHYDKSPRDVQRAVFEAQLTLAGEMHLPVIVHTREAEADTRAIVERAGTTWGVLHCFTGTAELAAWAVERGFYVSFAGIVTFQSADALRDVARAVPLDRILVETDCPLLAPVPYRRKRNEPAFVTRVAETVAALKGVSAPEFDSIVSENFHRLFGA